MKTFLSVIFLVTAIALSAGTASAQSAGGPGPSGQAATPIFKLGFATLASLIPDVAGSPIEDEHYGANGDSLQQTTKGLMVWRKADNWTAFTNGATTWINGPFGVQSRANDARFSWEGQATASTSDPSEIDLWDRRSIATAYIAPAEDNTIYLWTGEPVAYLYGEHIYGFNGVHLGWFLDGVVYDYEGVGLGFSRQAPYVAQNNEPPKAPKQPKPVRQPREPAPPMPPTTLGVYTELLSTMLRWGVS